MSVGVLVRVGQRQAEALHRNFPVFTDRDGEFVRKNRTCLLGLLDAFIGPGKAALEFFAERLASALLLTQRGVQHAQTPTVFLLEIALRGDARKGIRSERRFTKWDHSEAGEECGDFLKRSAIEIG